MKKFLKKPWGIVLVSVLLAVAVSALFGAFTKGFTDFDLKTPNEDNILSVENYNENLDAKREDGLEIEVSEHGEISVSGKNKTEEAVQIAVQEVTLEVGKYTFSSGAKNTDKDTYFMSIVNGEQTVIADQDEDSTFTITANDTTCAVYITVNAGETIDTTFRPVLVEGSEAGSFFVIGK